MTEANAGALPTPSQTVGPFYGYALPYPGGPDIAPADHPDTVTVHGYVYDGTGEPVPDALLEVWGPDCDGQIPTAPGSLRRDQVTGGFLVPQPATFAPSRRPARPLAAPAESPSTSSTRTSGRHAESTHRTPFLDGQTLPAGALSGLGEVRHAPTPPGTAPRRVVAAPEDAQYEGTTPPCGDPHRTTRKRTPLPRDRSGRDGVGFTGFGRIATDRDGRWMVRTLRPGARGGSAPYLSLCVFARGLLHHLYTRIYLPEDAAAHAADPLLATLPAERRATLVATAGPHRGYGFDVRLQGADETVFLEFK